MSAPAFGDPHHELDQTDSTNDRARELALDGAPSGTVVTAREQTAGRGRRGRTWSAPPGKALLYSAILRPLGLEHVLLPLAVPVAAAEACEACAGDAEIAIKWPNDLWLDEHKLGGILIEARPPDWAVIGIGINVAVEPGEFPAELRWAATSLGGGATVAGLRSELNEALSRWVEAPQTEVLEAFAARDALRGREISWVEVAAGGDAAGADETAESLSGVADGIDERGNLVVVGADGERLSLGSGEVQLRL